MSVGAIHGQTSQEGSITPRYSAWGQALKAAAGDMIEHVRPIGKHVTGRPTFGGTAGAFTAIAASIHPLQPPRGYFGDAPDSLQDSVDSKPPWER